ncbi:MAG: DUF1329 domain-containing protein [Deltaproteobacteria bacterium]|nr:DUF1329 domain-containing protein [Deltaproteobacteria bacterium]
MRKAYVWVAIVCGTLACGQQVGAEMVVAEALRSTFYPYSQETVRYEGITPGLTIGQQNWQVAEKILPSEILKTLQAGDFTITVQETTDLPVREAYVAATEQYANSVSLDGGYKVNSYQGGRPFPVIDPADPRAGEKIAWNFRYRDLPDSMEMRGTMQGVNNAGTIDRSNIGRMRFRFGMHRVGEEANDVQWQERGVYAKLLFESLAPSDQEGNMRITTVYDDENVANDELSYSPSNRRTRKSYMNMLARMGGGRYDVLAEEQPPFYFIGYLHEYNWNYKGEQAMLVPGFLRADHLTFGGKNNWYPNVPWELRRVITLEVTPKGPHPYGRRVYYLDAQTYTPFYVLSYDPQGTFVRFSVITHGNPDFSPGARGVRLPVPLGATWVNVVHHHASQMVAGNPLFKQNYSPRRFELMELLRRGK